MKIKLKMLKTKQNKTKQHCIRMPQALGNAWREKGSLLSFVYIFG
jgi:hypothetical protein